MEVACTQPLIFHSALNDVNFLPLLKYHPTIWALLKRSNIVFICLNWRSQCWFYLSWLLCFCFFRISLHAYFYKCTMTLMHNYLLILFTFCHHHFHHLWRLCDRIHPLFKIHKAVSPMDSLIFFLFGRQVIWPCYILCMYALWIWLQDVITCGLWSNFTIQASLLLSLLLSKSCFISYNVHQTLIALCLSLYRGLKCQMEKGVEEVARPALHYG